MHCAGFPSDTYDRYVLGLLEEPDRSQLEAQIQEQCPACLSGVQRSMNLWLVFAETLENAEPSEDFRGRIVRIAELSRKVLTFPKNSALRERPSVLVSTLLAICAVTAVLLVATWYAGRASLRLDSGPATADLEKLAQEVAGAQVKLQQETVRRQQVESELGSSGHATNVHTKQLEESLRESQADVEQYKSVIAMDKQQLAENTSLLNAFTRAGAKLLAMKATEAAGKSLAYALIAENSKLLFVASNMPKPAPGHTFQLWLLRKEEPKAVSAGLFKPPDSGPAVVQYEQAALLSNVAGILVTEEPTDGSETPVGTKLLEVSTAEEN